MHTLSRSIFDQEKEQCGEIACIKYAFYRNTQNSQPILLNLLFGWKPWAQYYNSTKWYFNVLLARVEAVTSTSNSKHASEFAGVTDDAILL